MADSFTARTETSEESLEAAGLEVVVAAATTETAREAQGLDVVVAATTDTQSTDDVWIDGNIITAENYDAALSQDGNDLLIVNNGDGSDFLEGGSGADTVQVNGADGAGDDFSISPNGQRAPAAGQDGRDLLIVNNGDGSDFLEGGAGNDFVQVNGANGAGDDFSIDPNGERVRDSGEGNDLPSGGDGIDVLRGGAGNDVLLNRDGNDIVLAEEGADPLMTTDTLVFTDAFGTVETPEISGQTDFYYVEYADPRQSDAVPAENFSLNYEQIKDVDETGFDSVFDAM